VLVLLLAVLAAYVLIGFFVYALCWIAGRSDELLGYKDQEPAGRT